MECEALSKEPQTLTHLPFEAAVSKPFVKDQIVNIFGFMSHVVSATTTQLCQCSMKTAIDSTRMTESGCVPIKLYLQRQVTHTELCLL